MQPRYVRARSLGGTGPPRRGSRGVPAAPGSDRTCAGRAGPAVPRHEPGGFECPPLLGSSWRAGARSCPRSGALPVGDEPRSLQARFERARRRLGDSIDPPDQPTRPTAKTQPRVVPSVPAQVERKLAPELTRCEILKLSHHGSATSTAPVWLRALAPRIAIASAGRRSRVGAPRSARCRAVDVAGHAPRSRDATSAAAGGAIGDPDSPGRQGRHVASVRAAHRHALAPVRLPAEELQRRLSRAPGPRRSALRDAARGCSRASGAQTRARADPLRDSQALSSRQCHVDGACLVEGPCAPHRDRECGAALAIFPAASGRAPSRARDRREVVGDLAPRRDPDRAQRPPGAGPTLSASAAPTLSSPGARPQQPSECPGAAISAWISARRLPSWSASRVSKHGSAPR